MQIICISRGSYAKGQELATSLSDKLGWQCVSREELVEAATKRGIAVGKLEAAILKPHIFNERLALVKDHFQAFATMYLLERALQGDFVYHGRIAHLLLPGIRNLLRIRVVADMEYRVNVAMRNLNLSREKAKAYVQEVDDDRKRWGRLYYGVDWDAVFHYDMVLNLEKMNVENAAAVLCTMAQLPDFQSTPASQTAIENLLLASRARVALAEHEATYYGSFIVRADNGVVSVVYQLQNAQMSDQIPRVLGKLDGVKDIVCTMAQTNIMWVQECYDPDSESFRELVSLANKWDAAVELLRLEAVEANGEQSGAAAVAAPPRFERTANGGIEDDVEDAGEAGEDGGLSKTLTELARLGRSGGGRSVCTTPNRVKEFISHTTPYSLIVVGDVFLSKGHAAQKRMARDLSGLLQEKLKVPVVLVDELKSHFLFGPRQLINLLVFAVIAVTLFFLVFSNQTAILRFLHNEGAGAKALAAVGVFFFVPIFAYCYGTMARLIFKLARIE